MDLLPQVSAEDLNQGDFERRDLAVHEDSSEVQLDLETNVHVGSVDGGGPPKREPPIWNLIET